MPKQSWFKVVAAADADASDEISIYDEIGGWGVTAKEFIGDLKALKQPNLTLSINSPGGSVFDAIAIYNALRASGKTVTVRVMGVAASAASLIAMAGDKIVMPENAFMMVHNPLTFAYGNSDELRDMADVLDKIGASLIGTYVARTGKSEEEVKALLDAETWLSAADAVEAGFADEVEPVLAIAASFDPERLPEQIRAVYAQAGDGEAIDDPETPPVAEPGVEDPEPQPEAFSATDAQALVAAAGFEAHAAQFVLRHSDKASLDTAIINAAEVRSLCAVAGKPEMTESLLFTPVAEVRAKLLDAIATVDEQNQTDGTQPLDGTPKIEKPTAGIKTADIWASRRQS